MFLTPKEWLHVHLHIEQGHYIYHLIIAAFEGTPFAIHVDFGTPGHPGETRTVDGQNPGPLGNHEKPLFVGIYKGLMIPGLLTWCRILSIDSMSTVWARLGVANDMIFSGKSLPKQIVP